ncbi:hypothetical protein CSQ80_00455 [Cyanobacterium aponinum IPPAS B-1201]|nr:hypothetical protein CSQ80_00455 [Cyanobacterium aponinum IPPAS B-1201]
MTKIMEKNSTFAVWLLRMSRLIAEFFLEARINKNNRIKKCNKTHTTIHQKKSNPSASAIPLASVQGLIVEIY